MKEKRIEKMKQKDAAGFRLGGYYRKLCVGSTLLNLISVPVALLTATLVSGVADAAVGGDFPTVLRKSVIVLAVLAAVFALRTGAAVWEHRENTVVGNRCRVEFLGMFLRNPAHRLFTADEGEIHENLDDDLTECAGRFTGLLPSVIVAGLSVAVYLIFLSRQSLLVAGALLGVSLLQVIPPLAVKKFFERFYDENREVEAQETNHIAEAVDGFDTIKLYGLTAWWQSKLEGIIKKEIRTGNGAEAACTAEDVIDGIVSSVLKFGTYAMLGFFAMKRWITMETVVQAVCLSAELFAGVYTLFQTIPGFATAARAQKRLDKWAAPAAPQAVGPKPAEALAFEKTGYTIEEKEVVRGLTARFRATENYLLTGPNGAGKSTLLHLLTGVVLPTDGAVKWEDRYAASVPIGAAPEEVLLIPQQDPPFHFSAVELYEMFDETRRDDMLRLAARFGLERDRLEAPLTELSGGERKKVFLAMGFGASSRWLLLDEPTNSLDEAGKQILAELIQARGGVLAVSHDPALSPVFPHTLTMEGGVLL